MVYKWKPQLGTKLYFCADMLLSTRPGVFLPVKVPWTWNKFWLRNDLSWKWFFSGRSRIWITRFSWCTHRVELCTMFKWKMMLKLSQDMHVSSKALLCSRSGHKPYLPRGKPILPPPPFPRIFHLNWVMNNIYFRNLGIMFWWKVMPLLSGPGESPIVLWRKSRRSAFWVDIFMTF